MTYRSDPRLETIRCLEDEVRHLRANLAERNKDRLALNGYDEPRLGMMLRAEMARADYFEERTIELEKERYGPIAGSIARCARTTHEPQPMEDTSLLRFDLGGMGRTLVIHARHDYRASSEALVEKDAWNIANDLARQFLPAIRKALHLGAKQ